jgi:tetratricopeptide (TPR) repeat protein
MDAGSFPFRRPGDAELWARCADRDPATRAEALRELAARAARVGRTTAAIDLLEAAIAGFELSGDDLARGLALVSLVDVLVSAGRRDDAVDTAWAAVALLDSVAGDRHIADAWWMLAVALRASFDAVVADGLGRERTSRPRVTDEPVSRPRVTDEPVSRPRVTDEPAPPADTRDQVVGVAADRAEGAGYVVPRGEVVELAVELAEVAERAAWAATVSGVPLVPGRATLLSAEALHAAGRAREAEAAFRAAEVLARDARDPLTAANCRLGLAGSLLDAGRAAEALTEARGLPDVYAYLQCDDRTADALTVLAQAHARCGDDFAARDCLAWAAELYARAGDVVTAAVTDWEWARLVLDSAGAGPAERSDAEEIARSSAAVLALLGTA